MGFCAIDNNESLASVYRYVRESIENAIINKKNINPEAIAKELYDYVIEQSKDKDKALSYAHLIPDMIRQAAGASTKVSDYMVDTNFNLNAINKKAKEWRTAPDLNAVAKYIGVEIVTAQDAEEAAKLAAQQQSVDDVEEKLLDTWVEVVDYAIPNSLFTTTGQEALPGKKNIPDPAVAMHYTVLRNIIRNGLQLKGYSGKVYLTTMALSRLSPDKLDSRQKAEIDADPGLAANLDKIFVQVLTDAQGNPLNFNSNGEYIEKDGKNVYFYVRQTLETVQTPKTEEEAKKLQLQKKTLDNSLAMLAQDPANNIIINEITGGDVGFLEFSQEPSRVSDLSMAVYPSLSIKKGPDNNIYLTSPTMNKDVQIYMDAITETEASEMADFLLNPISYNKKGVTTRLKESDKANFFFFFPSGSGRISLMKKGDELVIKIDGKTVDASTPNAKELIVDAIINNTNGNLYLYKNNLTTVRTFSNVRPSSDGTYSATIDTLQYNDFIRKHSYVAQSIQNGDFVPFNAYFEFMPAGVTAAAVIVEAPVAEVQTYKNVPIEEKSITSKTGEPGGAQYSYVDNKIYINKSVLKAKFDAKAWTTPRVQKDGSVAKAFPEDMFKTYEEWEAFVIEHEYQHSLLSRSEFDKSVTGPTTTGQYEDEINKRALKELGREIPEVVVQTKEESILDKIKGKIDTSLLLRAGRKINTVAAAEEFINAAMPWYNSIVLPDGRMLKDVVPVSVMFDAINADPSVVAHWNMAGITLWKGADASDLYHESWHMFSQIFLSRLERESLYDAVGKMKGSFENYKGETVAFSKATKLEKEEWLAEQFREHMLRGGKGKYSKGKGIIANIFNKIYQLLNYLFNNTTIQDTQADYAANAKVAELFDKLAVGRLGEPLFEVDDVFVETGLNKIKNLSASDTSVMVTSLNGLISEATDQLNDIYNTKGITVGIISEQSMRESAYLLAKDKVAKRVAELQDKLAKAAVGRKPKIERRLKQAMWMLENFGNPENPKEGETLLSYYEKNHIRQFEPDMADKDDNTTSRSEYADKSGNEVSVKSMIDKKLTYTLSTLVQYSDKGTVETNDLGFPKTVPYRQALNLLMNITQGVRNPKEIYDKLKEVEELFPIVKAFLNKVGSPDLIKGDLENSMWGQINKLFTLPRVTIVNLDVEQVRDENNKISYVTIRPGNASRESSKVYKAFNSKFVRSAETEPYRVKETATGAVYINIEELTKDLYNQKSDVMTDPIAFLNAIGLYVPNLSVIKNVLSSKETGNVYELVGLRTKVRAINAFNTWLKLNKPGAEPIKLSRVTDILDKNMEALIPNKNLREEFLKQESQYKASAFNAFTGFKTTLGNLYLHWTGDFSNSTVTTTTGKTKYENSLPNTITKKTDSINAAINYEDLVRDNSENTNGMPVYIMNNLSLNRNPWMQNSMIMNMLFDMQSEGKVKRIGIGRTGKAVTARINILDMDGTKMRIGQEIDLVGLKSSDSDMTTKLLQDFYMMMIFGTSEATRHAGKSSTFLYQIIQANGSKHYIEPKAFASTEGNSSLGKSRLREAYMNYLSSEVERIFKSKTDPEAKNIVLYERKGKAVSLADVGSKFVMFDDILTADQKTELYKLIDKGTIKSAAEFKQYMVDNVDFANTYQNQVNAYLEDQYDQVYNKFKEEGILDSRFLLSPTILRTVGEVTKENRDQLARQMVEAYTANQLLHNVETGLVYYGDPGIYNHLKEEYHKRNAGIGSTGEIPRTDINFQNFVNRPDKKGKYAESQWYTGPKTKADGTTVGQRDFNGTFNTAVLADVVSTSVYLEEYKEAARKKELARLNKINASEETIKKALETIDETFDDAYKGMKEGDAQGWISFDSYRLLMKGLDKWTNSHERLYNKILAGEEVSASDISNFFPIKKMQYWGTLATTGLPVEAFHKFSLMPLIPTVVKGTKLEQLHNKMVEQDIDYAVFASGSKLGTVTNNGEFDKFYATNEGQLALNEPDFNFSKNVIYADYLKDQVEVAPEFKEKIIFSTQLRKLVEEGSFENGVPVDFKPEITGNQERYDAWKAITDESEKVKESKLYGKILRYEAALRQLTEFKKQQLVEELGWTEGVPKDLNKFINFVEKQLTRQEISDNELEFIDALKDAPMVNFDLSNFGPQIEKLLTAVVNKRLIRQKVTGEALIQASSAGFENAGKFRNATEEERKKFGTNDLKFYRPGEPMEVKISMQGHFKKLLNIPEVNKIAKEQGISKLDALNIVIKDAKWLAKNKDMITMTGVRIPVQGLNSMEVMQIAQFLPEEAGNMIVPATEIVAKSGADFDIDKLSIQMPVLRWEGLKGNSKLVLAQVRSKEQLTELYDNLKAKAFEIEDLKVIYGTVNEAGELEYDKAKIRQAFYKDTSKVRERFSKDIELSNKLLNTVLSTALGENWSDLGYTEDEIEQILKSYSLSQNVDDFIKKMNNEAAYENQLLLATKDLILDPENFVSLITPNSTSIVKPISEELRDKTRVYSSKKRFNGEANGFSPTRIYEPLYNIAKLEYNSVGKQALGIGAVDNTYSTIYNRIGAYMSEYTRINEGGNTMLNRLLLPHNTISINNQDRISLSHAYDKNGLYKISDLFNQLLNGWVDVEKDEWIFDLQGNRELTPVLLFMIQAGVPIRQAVLMLSQPLVREYIADARSRKGTFSSVLGKQSEENMQNVDARDNILFGDNNKYGFNLNLKDFLPEDRRKIKANSITGKPRPAKYIIFNYINGALDQLNEEDFSEKALEDNLSNLNSSKTKDKYTEFDRNVFMHFLEILEMSKGQTEIKQALKYDTTRSASLYDARVQLRKDIKASLNRGFDSEVYESIVKNSPIGSFKIQEFMIDLYEPFFPLTNSEAINSYLNTPNIESKLSKNGEVKVSFTDKTKIVGEFRKQLAPYIFYNSYFNLPTGKYYRGRLLDNELPIATTAYTRRGAIYGDGKIYVDETTINENLNNEFYSNELQYFDADVAPLPSNVFTGVNANKMYRKYLYERESLRSLSNYTYKTVAESQEYKKLEKELSEMYLGKTALLKGKSTVIDEPTVKLWAYETYLRNHALNNMNLPFWTFTGKNSFAYQYDNIISNPAFKSLVGYYQLLDALEVDVMTGKNPSNVNTLRFRDTLLDIDQKNLYSENLNELKNPALLQSKFNLSAIDAENISKFFNRFDVVAYLQSASNPNSTFSILSIADSKVISNLIAEPISKFIDTVNQLSSLPGNQGAEVTKLLFDQYRKIFISTNSNKKATLSKRFRTFNDENFSRAVLSTNKDAVIAEFLKQAKVEVKEEQEAMPEAFYEDQVSATQVGPETKINIYAGTGENAELSNFAVRPFDFWVGDKVRKFKTVEGAFQASKLGSTNSFLNTKKLTAEQTQILETLQNATGAQAKALGKNIKDLNVKNWDDVSSKRMKPLLLESFKQNPDALAKLLATGNAELTHTQDKGKWGTEFPKLLMEVRDELRGEQPTAQVEGFQGYKGGFEDKGKGTPQGDGKDKAMRQVADGGIFEVASNKPSSTATSAKEIGILDQKGKTVLSQKNTAVAPTVVMLARNGALKGQPLEETTKNTIDDRFAEGAEFVVGDMPGVDSQFIDYLQEIGAKFTIYHTGATPRVQVKQATAQTTTVKPTQPVQVVQQVEGFGTYTQAGTNLPVYYFSKSPDSFKPADVQKIKELDPNAIYVTDTVMAKPGSTPNTTGLNKTNAVLAGLGPDNYFGIPTKFLANPIDNKTGRPIGTVNKTTNQLTPAGLLSDENYDYNIQQIEAAIIALKQKQADNPDKVIKFNYIGIGQSMINRYENNGNAIQPVGENVPANQETAEKTFVYLSKRLYEEFGYVNNNSLPRKFSKGSTEMMEALQRDQTVSDTQVTKEILNDILSCSI